MTGPLARLADAVAFVGRTDLRNLAGFGRAARILARPAPADWWYAREYTLGELPAAARHFLLDAEKMNEFQQHSPEAGYTSTPADGLLAGFTAEGRLSSLFAPHTGFTEQVPYLQTGDGRLGGSKPREGAFLGVRYADGEVAWLWTDAFDHAMTVRDRTNLLRLDYRPADGRPGVRVVEHAYVVPETGVLARDFAVSNDGERDVDALVYYMQANANAHIQYPIGATSPNRARAGDALVWDDTESDAGLRVFADAPVADAGVADAPLDEALDAGTPTAAGRYLGGYLALDAPLAPGERAAVTVYTTGGDAPDRDAGPLAWDAERRRAFVRDWWDATLTDVPVDAVPERYAGQYVRSVVGLAMLYDPASGSLSAAPNSQPSYYLSWPRDGAFAAVALAEAGLGDIATDYLGRFCPRVQSDEGSFEQCYASTGEAAGVVPVENDQQSIYVHAVRRVHEATGDDAFLDDAWPAVRRAADYTVSAVADNGLLAATPDFAEMWTDARQSLWTNAFAYRGLRDAAALAAERGQATRARRYRRAADRIGDATDRAFFADVADAEGFATSLTVTGAEREETTAFAVAIHPTGWAAAYDRADELLDAFGDAYRDAPEQWLPQEFAYAAACYDCGRLDAGDAVLDDLAAEHLPGGTLAEVVDPDGDHRYAALGWSNASFVHAVHERAAALDGGDE